MSERDQRRTLEVLALVARFREGRTVPPLRETTTHAAAVRLGEYALNDEPDDGSVLTELLDGARMFLDLEGWSLEVVNLWCDSVLQRSRVLRYPPPNLRAVPDA